MQIAGQGYLDGSVLGSDQLGPARTNLDQLGLARTSSDHLGLARTTSDQLGPDAERHLVEHLACAQKLELETNGPKSSPLDFKKEEVEKLESSKLWCEKYEFWASLFIGNESSVIAIQSLHFGLS